MEIGRFQGLLQFGRRGCAAIVLMAPIVKRIARCCFGAENVPWVSKHRNKPYYPYFFRLQFFIKIGKLLSLLPKT